MDEYQSMMELGGNFINLPAAVFNLRFHVLTEFLNFDFDALWCNSDRKRFFRSYFSRPSPSVAKHALMQRLHEVNR